MFWLVQSLPSVNAAIQNKLPAPLTCSHLCSLLIHRPSFLHPYPFSSLKINRDKKTGSAANSSIATEQLRVNWTLVGAAMV